MSDPLTRAEAVAVLAGRLHAEHGLDNAPAFLAAHLVVAHGWGVDAAVRLNVEERKIKHAGLAHDQHHH